MIRVLLINQDVVPHFRVPIYGYLSRYLLKYGFDFMVVSGGIQEGNPHSIKFKYTKIHLNAYSLLKIIYKKRIDIIIFWVNLKYLYLFPTAFISKFVFKKKIIYWGHGRDLLDLNAQFKNLCYAIQQRMSDSIIIYAEHLKRYIPTSLHRKLFVANNTLYLNYQGLSSDQKENVLSEYGIYTRKNIICIGRMHKRKRLDHLVEAFLKMNRNDIGLILVGPDPDGILEKIKEKNVFKIGAIYGDKRFDLLSAADVYCLPGAVGLSIVDAFYCGLPLVTEDGDESPEIMYLKDGVNGFIVNRGNVNEMGEKLQLLLDNDKLRKQFSSDAKRVIGESGNIEQFCVGFREALYFAIK